MLQRCACAAAEEPAVVKLGARPLPRGTELRRPPAPPPPPPPLSLLQLRSARRPEDVLCLAAANLSSPGWGAAGAAEALQRLARTLSIFDNRVQSQARTSKTRGVAARRDPRYAVLSAAVRSSLVRADLRVVDVVRSAFATLGDTEGARAADAIRNARFRNQEALEALQGATSASEVSALVAEAQPLSPDFAVAALEWLASKEALPAEEAAAASETWRLLTAALSASLLPSLLGELPSRVLHALARGRSLGPAPPELVLPLAERLLRRGTLNTMHLLRCTAALRLFRGSVQLPQAQASALGRHVCAKLPSCPEKLVVLLLRDSLVAGAPWAMIAPLATPLLARPSCLAHASSGLLIGLAEQLSAAGDPALAAKVLAAASPKLGVGADGPGGGRGAPGRTRALGGVGGARSPPPPHPQWLSRSPRRIHVRCAASARGQAPLSPDEPPPLVPAAVALAFSVPALGGLLFGYDIGSAGAALASLRDAATSSTAWGPLLSPLQSGSLVSASLASALLASLLALTFGEKTGRLAELRLAALLYSAGALLQATAPSFELLLCGRAVYGAGIGFAMHAAPLYLGETADARVRGTLISAKEAFIVGGILLGYIAGALFVNADAGWRSVFAASLLAAVPMGLLSVGLLESPRWLLSSGAGQAAAGAALQRLRGSPCEAELRGMAAAAASAPPSRGPAALLEPRNRRALYVGVSLMFFQQFTGQPSVLYYAVDIFKAAGFGQAASQVSVLLGAFKLGMTLVAVATVDRLGRRPLLLGGVATLTGSLLALALLSGSADGSPLATLAFLLLYVGAYQLSFGPISWLMVGEVFPANVRSEAVGLATVVNFGSNALVAAFLPSLQAAAGQEGTYAVFAGLGLLALTSIALTVPETKGKTLEEIEAGFEA